MKFRPVPIEIIAIENTRLKIDDVKNFFENSTRRIYMFDFDFFVNRNTKLLFLLLFVALSLVSSFL